jgi:hypothetical protein
MRERSSKGDINLDVDILVGKPGRKTRPKVALRGLIEALRTGTRNASAVTAWPASWCAAISRWLGIIATEWSASDVPAMAERLASGSESVNVMAVDNQSGRLEVAGINRKPDHADRQPPGVTAVQTTPAR